MVGTKFSLKEMREQRGVTQKAVANHLGIARQTYSRYENHQEKLSIDQALAICSFLHCNMDDIFLDDDVCLSN